MKLNRKLTKTVVDRLGRAERHQAVIVEAPPGAGKSTLTASVAKTLVDGDATSQLAVVTQTNEQADDLVVSLSQRYRRLTVARLVGGSGPSDAIDDLQADGRVSVGTRVSGLGAARVIVGTARKWQYERSRLQQAGTVHPYRYALIDEAYQMRSDLKKHWPPDLDLTGAPPLVQHLAAEGIWLEQEPLALDPRVPPYLQTLVEP